LKDIYYIGDSQQLKIVYDAALSDNADKSTDKSIHDQISAAILSRTSNTNTNTEKPEPPKENNSSETSPHPSKKLAIKPPTLKFIKNY
jgi:hypothetical protein